jgi:hypothetical protein
MASWIGCRVRSRSSRQFAGQARKNLEGATDGSNRSKARPHGRRGPTRRRMVGAVAGGLAAAAVSRVFHASVDAAVPGPTLLTGAADSKTAA